MKSHQSQTSSNTEKMTEADRVMRAEVILRTMNLKVTEYLQSWIRSVNFNETAGNTI